MRIFQPNFIYAYDNENRQIIIIDAETGEEISDNQNPVQSLLEFINEKNNGIGLRIFSVWCARRCNPTVKPLQKKFFDLANRAIKGQAQKVELTVLYEKSEREAVAIDTVGLRQGAKKAPGFLASRECINPNALAGARNAARYHYLWAGLDTPGGKTSPYKIISPSGKSLPAPVIQAQVNFLLDVINGELDNTLSHH